MDRTTYLQELHKETEALVGQGLFKKERVIATPQGAAIRVQGGAEVLNFCANNYLGLANHPKVVEAAKRGLDRHGYGMASVRFICGTQDVHKELEARLSRFLGTEDTILYSSCFDANGGVFEALLGPEDAVISDALNHASVIDGIRLCKARRLRYAHRDADDLARCLGEAADARFRLIVSDGVFSMSGAVADLAALCALAERHRALLMVDDSHAVGVLGEHGRGTAEHCQVVGRIDLLTGTLGKALGGASGGYASGRREIISLLRQRSRPYLFSNSLPPCIASAALTAIELASAGARQRQKLAGNARFFRAGLAAAGFTVLAGEHPIIPIMLGDAALAARFAEALLEQGIYAVGFGYPVVEQGLARIRCQISAGHTRSDLVGALAAFTHVARALGCPLCPPAPSAS
jgi:glycine C-acetyltransferase